MTRAYRKQQEYIEKQQQAVDELTAPADGAQDQDQPEGLQLPDGQIREMLMLKDQLADLIENQMDQPTATNLKIIDGDWAFLVRCPVDPQMDFYCGKAVVWKRSQEVMKPWS